MKEIIESQKQELLTIKQSYEFKIGQITDTRSAVEIERDDLYLANQTLIEKMESERAEWIDYSTKVEAQHNELSLDYETLMNDRDYLKATETNLDSECQSLKAKILEFEENFLKLESEYSALQLENSKLVDGF